jgi:O-antigen chain-terminating methyltransferase
MTTMENPSKDMDRLVEDLRKAVDERYRSQEYPSDLDSELGQHFERVSSRQGGLDLRFGELLRELDQAARFDRSRIPMVSSVPLGSQLHRAIGKATSRQVVGVLLQMQAYAASLRELLVEVIDTLSTESATQLSARVDALMEQLAVAGRELDGKPSPESSATAVIYNPWFTQSAFMERFRGSREEILSRYRPLATRLAGLGPVVDIGSGRGEMLELLRDSGTEAIGVDLDPDMVAACRDRGLQVDVGDGVTYLQALEEGSLGGVFAGQLIEHLTPQGLLDFMALVSTRLRPGGILIAETINPESLWVFAHSYHIDPTHVRPVHPAYAAFLAQEAGFTRAEIEYRSPVQDEVRMEMVPDRDDGASDLRAALNRNFDRLDRLLFAPQDYALIATR